MNQETNTTKKKRPVKKILLWITSVFFIIIVVIAVLVYKNFNQLLSNALLKSFNSNIISDVYELKFEKLSVNFLIGNVKVYNVQLQPREKPLQNYPYINSSIRLSTKKMLLENVQLGSLIKSNILRLDKIEITEPDVELKIGDKIPILFPLKDTHAVEGRVKQVSKKSIESFFLEEFKMVDASFHVNNSAKKRELKIQKLNISVNDLMIDQDPGKDMLSYKQVQLSMGELTGTTQKESIKYISFKDYKIVIDSLEIQRSVDTLIFHFSDFNTGLKMLDIQTADSISHLTVESFNLSYKEKSIKLNTVVFKPNISEAAMQKRFTYQNTQFSGAVDTINLLGVNFDSLIYKRKILIDEIFLDKMSAFIFRDQRKPVDKNRFPEYLGQQIKAIGLPLLIKQVKATNANLVNTERKPDGGYAKANINRATLYVKNITNLPSDEMLTINAAAYIENKALANLSLRFSYMKPQFSINGTVKKFNLPDLNPLLNSYTPAGIEKGITDELTFSGNAYRTNASGTMKFLYHDLKVNVSAQKKATWGSSVLNFAANAYLDGSNPASPRLPPRVVKFRVERDMHKGFINILIKSVLGGVMETMNMSEENQIAYRKAKKDAKKQARKKRKNK